MARKIKYIADYIYDEEIACKCEACKQKKRPSLPPMRINPLTFWQKVSNARHIRGIPMIFVSGYRCPEHPESILNPNSAHGQCLAADFYEKGVAIYDTFIFWAMVFQWNGIGYTERGGTIHIDDKPHRYGRWSYKRVFKGARYTYKPVYLITCKV